LLRTARGTVYGMGGSERNAAGLKSGNAVAHSAPVLTRPTSPQLPVESRRLAPAQNAVAALHPVQPKSGRGVGQSPTMLDAPVNLEDGDIAKLVELFLLLDSWDREAASCRPCLIACNSRHGDEVGVSQ
jgi:hypothetical protein